MKAVLKRYKTVFDELNILEQRIGKISTAKALDDFIDFLIDAYIEGFAGANYILGEELKINTESLSAALNRIYDDISIYEKFTQYLSDDDQTSLYRLMESEVHRVYNTGSYDCAEQSGNNLMKTWVTVGDERVRDTHAYLEGTSIPIDELFTTYDGDSALVPGGFMKAENNVNCRCILQYSKI